jgi:membrane-associated phospholipid phosphatase
MHTSAKLNTLVAMLILIIVMSEQAWGSTNHFARTASDSITPFLVVGELSLLPDKPEAVQGVKALVATGLITQGLKFIVREKRPNSESLTSFPSGHTSAAFAMATVLARYRPQYRIPAYVIASTIGWSRVEVGAHRWQDVAAGAALGYFIARRFANKHVNLSPLGLSYQWKS